MTEVYSISVITPCFNHGEFLGEAVASVLNAKRDDIELIVVDDGSTDELTLRVTDALREQGVSVIRQNNKGLSAARNTGIAASRGRYIFPLDADDRMCTGWIDQGIHILDSNSGVGVVHGDTEFSGTQSGLHRGSPLDLGLLLLRNCVPASALYRKAVWLQNGGYDESMHHGFEDWDFWVGAAERGWRFYYLPEALFVYRKATESMLTRSWPFEAEAAEFIVRKHSTLYRDGMLRLLDERDSLLAQRESVKWTARNLRRLLKSRVRQRVVRRTVRMLHLEGIRTRLNPLRGNFRVDTAPRPTRETGDGAP